MAAALAVVTTSLTVVDTLRHSDYVGDDIHGFFLARTTPFWTFLFTPIDVHYVPLYRLTFTVLAATAPMRHGAGVVVLTALYGLVLYAAWRLFRRVLPAPWPVFFVSLLAANACLGSLFVWFVAGLHRLPYLVCTLLALEQYVQYRQDGLPRRAVTIGALFVVALGFFSKTMLWPLYFAGLEACLPGSAPKRKTALWLAGGVLVASGIVAVVMNRALPETFRGVKLDPLFQLEFLRVGALMTLGSVLGFIYAEEPWQIALLGVALLGAVVPTVRREPRRGVAWGAALAVVTANVWMVSVPQARSGMYGLVMAWASYRYYFDIAALVLVFGGLAWSSRLSASPRVLGLAVVLLTAVHAGSAYQSVRLGESVFASFDSVHRYLANLRRDLAERAPTPEHPLEVVETQIPREILSFQENRYPMSLLFTAMAVEAHFGPRRDDAVEVDDDGHLVSRAVAREHRRHRARTAP